jgi:Flp pilus assembly protein TadD
VDLAGRAVTLTGRQDAQALDVLAVALASAGRFDEAVRTAREALVLATPPLSTAIAARLALFERGEAYVDRQ